MKRPVDFPSRHIAPDANRPKPVAHPPQTIIKTQYPFGLKMGEWITIIIACVTGLFKAGYYFGNTKFDKDKIQYYNEVQSLAADTTTLHKAIDIKDSLLRIKNDSLVHLNNTITGFDILPSNQSK